MKSARRARRAARQIFRACQVEGRLDPARVRQATETALRLGRRGTHAVLSDLLRLVRLDRDRHRAVVESASSLPEDVRLDIDARLTRAYGAGLEMSYVVAPALIGGVRIRVGSDVYDDSVQARLAALERRL